MNQGTSAILVEEVWASYGRGARQVRALRGVSLDIRRGEIFGMLGPNGAGKTTLLSCIEGIHRPDRGMIWVEGVEVARQPAHTKAQLGIQLQHTALLDDLTVGELIEVYAALYDVHLSTSEIGLLLRRFDLEDQRRTLARRLSGGQKQRLALAIAVANDPEIVLLDEPTSALDPRARRAVWSIIRALHDEGRTVVLTTHAMEEAEALCGRVAIIDGGQVVACDTPAGLIASLNARPVLKTRLDLDVERALTLPGAISARVSGEYLEIETAEPQLTLAELQTIAAHAGHTMSDVMLRQPNLEDVFLRLTGRQLAS